MPTRKTVKRDGKPDPQAQLETAMAVLINNQATFIQNLAEIQKENAERFSRIEQLLIKHELILQELPEAIRKKIGFKE